MNNRVPEWKDVALGQVPPSSTNIKEKVIYRNNDVIGFPFKETYHTVGEIPVKMGDFVTFTVGDKKYSGRLKYTEIEHDGMVDKWYYIGNLGMLAYSFDMEDGSPYYDIPLNDNVPYIVGFEMWDNVGSESGNYFECVEVIDRYNPEEQYPTSESVTVNINGLELGYIENCDSYCGSCGKFSLDEELDDENYVFIFDGVRYTLSPDYQDVLPNIICDFDGTTFSMINKPMFHHTVKLLTETAEQDNGYGWSEGLKKTYFNTIEFSIDMNGGDSGWVSNFEVYHDLNEAWVSGKLLKSEVFIDGNSIGVGCFDSYGNIVINDDFMLQYDSEDATIHMRYDVNDGSHNVIVKLFDSKEIVHKINSKYLPTGGGSEPMYVEFQGADLGSDGWSTFGTITDLTSDEWVAIGNDCLNDVRKARNIAIRVFDYDDINKPWLIASQTSACIWGDGLQIYFIMPSPFNGSPDHGYIRLDFTPSDGWSIYAY